MRSLWYQAHRIRPEMRHLQRPPTPTPQNRARKEQPQ
nr:MAG TPA: Transcriptional regulator, SIX1, N-terminal SD domain [Caudoviricetes sp.]